MANRDINIPVGPDRTGELDFTDVQIPPEGEMYESKYSVPSIDPLEPKPVGAYTVPEVMPRDVPDPAAQAVPGGVPQVVPEVVPEAASTGAMRQTPAAEPVDAELIADEAQAGSRKVYSAPATEEQKEHMNGSGSSGVKADQEFDDMQLSFAALKDSFDQSRELKARVREREELGNELQADLEELADREYILSNYTMVMAEQDKIISDATNQREALKNELAQVAARTEETSEALSRMREYNAAQLAPFETTLGHARAEADQAKNDERSRKSELNAAETELRRANDSGDVTMATARRDTVKASYDQAVQRSNAAKEALEEAQRVHDEARQEAEKAEEPLERTIEDLEKQSNELKENITSLGDVITNARTRRQYCDTVFQYPEETEKLRKKVASNEETVHQMDSDNELLRGQLARNKAASGKAKIALGVVAAIVVILIILFIVLGMR